MIQRFIDAIKALAAKKVLPSEMASRDWQNVAPAIRQKSFFSATVANAAVLASFRNMLLDWQQGTLEQIQTPVGSSLAYKQTGLADFRLKAKQLLVSEGLATPDDFPDDNIKNIAGASRLKLIFNTNIEQAQTFANWQRIVTSPLLINQFPAARFMRRPGAKIKRPRHVANEREVRRLDDFAFWLFQNAPDIGGFDVPWGPFGFNSYMVQEFVPRAVAERLGLVGKDERVTPPNLTYFGVEPRKAILSGVKAEMKDVPDDIALQARQRLVDRFGPQVLKTDGSVSLDFLRSRLK
jgi:hypothetical protein